VACFAFLSILGALLCIPRIATTPGVRSSSSTINDSLASASSYHLPRIIGPEAGNASEASTLAVDLMAESPINLPMLVDTEEF
jgi:hypothetical protein